MRDEDGGQCPPYRTIGLPRTLCFVMGVFPGRLGLLDLFWRPWVGEDPRNVATVNRVRA